MPVKIFRVRDSSMRPSLSDGDYVVVSLLHYIFSHPKPRDMVVLKHPKKDLFIVKRIERETPYGYFVLGDNTTLSEDSRAFGTVDKSSIVGKVISVIRR